MSNNTTTNSQPQASAPLAAHAFHPDIQFPQITWEDITAAIDLAKSAPTSKLPDIPLSSLFNPSHSSAPPSSRPSGQTRSQHQRPHQQNGNGPQHSSSIPPAFSPSLQAGLKPQTAIVRPPPHTDKPVRPIALETNKQPAKSKRKTKKPRRNSEAGNGSKQTAPAPGNIQTARQDPQAKPQTREHEEESDANWHAARQQHSQQPRELLLQTPEMPQRQPSQLQQIYPPKAIQQQVLQSQQKQDQEPAHLQQTVPHPATENTPNQELSGQRQPSNWSNAPTTSCGRVTVPPPSTNLLPPAQLLPFLTAAYQSYQANAQKSQAQQNQMPFWPQGQLPFSIQELSAAVQAAQQQAKGAKSCVPQAQPTDMQGPAAKDVPCHARSQFVGMQGYNEEKPQELKERPLPVNGGIQKESMRGNAYQNWRKHSFPPQPNRNRWMREAQETWGSALHRRPDGSFHPADNAILRRHMGGRNSMPNTYLEPNMNMVQNLHMGPPGNVTPNRMMHYNRGAGPNRNMPQRRPWQPWRGGRSRGRSRRRNVGRRPNGRRDEGPNPPGMPMGMTHGAYNLQHAVKQETMVNAGSSMVENNIVPS